jgi:hypothetical protein
MCQKFTKIAGKTSCSEKVSTFLDGVLDSDEKQVDEKMSNVSNDGNSTPVVDEVLISMKNLSQNLPRLKKINGKKIKKKPELG